MLAASLDCLPDDLTGMQCEAKWDGFRALATRAEDGSVQLVSRRGTALGGAFPDIAAAAERDLPPGTLVDGELVIQSEGKLVFEALQQRLRSRRTAQRQADTLPAHMVLFDLLHTPSDGAIMAWPYHRRRAALERLFADCALGPPWTLCPATDDRTVMEEWLSPAWAAVGIDGVLLKPRQSPYTPGRRGGWRKVRSRQTTEALVGAVSPSRTTPRSVLLGRLDADGRLHYVGRTTPLSTTEAALLADILTPAGPDHPWSGRRFSPSWSSAKNLAVDLAIPELVAEIAADTAVDAAGRFRHLTRWVRLRLDMTAVDVLRFGEGNRPADG
ncbi:ATP-dependent DNA ligase [Streptomyces mobaraensis]|uniref:ATP-dependent DNA ligase n=2 Tax=Streptomyces mobaraensis TaxID=35621 RepID=A0A5N5VWK9_STRMB|nr:ATP-dependent DNA ligase [Streptomyces mobaraensis]